MLAAAQPTSHWSNPISALLFGSISTIADTSELQRQAFNQAFEAHGLGWRWNRDDYVTMLQGSGGQSRIAEYAESLGQTVDARAIHETKSGLFKKSLGESNIPPRPGVVETIEGAKREGLKVALVTTTSPANVSALLEALGPEVQKTSFDLILDSSSVEQPKPDPAAYVVALDGLGEAAEDCVAIEDNLGGVEAATASGLRCVAFPNQNTAGHDFDAGTQRVDRLDFSDLQTLIATR